MDLTTIEQIAWLRPLFETSLYGNSIGRYLIVSGSVFVVFLLGKLISTVLRVHAQKLTARTRTQVDDMILGFAHRSITFILVLGVLYSGLTWLHFSAQIDLFITKGIFILLTLKLATEIERLLAFFVTHYFLPMAHKQKGFLRIFIPPILHFNKFFVWSMAFLLIMNNLGYKVTSLITGLGIGGIALALAAQETLGNAFGSISILTDQPFRLNDYVVIGGHGGFVKELGIRSTKLQCLNGDMLTIPNKTVAGEVISNHSQRVGMGVDIRLGFEYHTSLQTIRAFLKELPKLIKRYKNVESESVRVHFTDFGDSSLHIEIYYMIKNPKFVYRDYLDCKQEINLKIIELADKLKADIAFPTQSIFIKNADQIRKTLKK